MKMEISNQSTETQYCFACLCNSEEYKLQDFMIKHTLFWHEFEVETIKLCYICRKLAQHTLLFIQNVQSNQILLQDYVGDSRKQVIKERQKDQKLPTILNQTCLYSMTFVEPTDNIDSDDTSKNESIKCEEWDVDMQTDIVKTEIPEDSFETHNADNSTEVDDNDEVDTTVIKQEKEDILLKNPTDTDTCKDEPVSKKMTPNKNDNNENNQSKSLDKPSSIETESEIELENEKYSMEIINITEEECFEERRRLALDPMYLNSAFKCESCVKGFNFQTTYDTHMRRHTDESLVFECRYCKIRMETEEKLHIHIKCHLKRFKCLLCGVLRSHRIHMVGHLKEVHFEGEVKLYCPYCEETFTGHVHRKNHVERVHRGDTCEICHKKYPSKRALKAHKMLEHLEATEKPEFKCEECGKMFRTPYSLKNHRRTHSNTKEFYCVECDKVFATAYIFKNHLTNTQIHVKAADLPFPCDRCEKRFSRKCDRKSHINAVHLKLESFKCDQCDKTVANKRYLYNHRRSVHEGYKPPLKYTCTLCDKRFDSKSKLKNHTNSHTGERPFQCDQCSATFPQSSSLFNHKKVKHQRPTSDGRPKRLSKRRAHAQLKSDQKEAAD